MSGGIILGGGGGLTEGQYWGVRLYQYGPNTNNTKLNTLHKRRGLRSLIFEAESCKIYCLMKYATTAY